MSKPFHVPQVSTGQAYAMLGGAALMMTLAMGIRQNLGLFQRAAPQGSMVTQKKSEGGRDVAVSSA